jgi:predicted amidohydrolase
VHVATLSLQQEHADTVEGNRERVMKLLEAACRTRPDIVCLPECFPTFGVRGKEADLAEPVPGPTTEAAAALARKYATHVVCPLVRRDGDNRFNSAVLLDRKGEVTGIYDKLFLPNTSWKAHRDNLPYDFGVTPGAEAGVFDLDFGRVGVQICFDMDFQDGWCELAERGAELVFWPSAYEGGFHLRLQAFLHHYYAVSSVTPSHAYIVNPIGEVLERSGHYRPIVSHTLDLDFMVCHFDWHRQKIRDIREKYGRDVVIRFLQEEGVFVITSDRDDLPLARVVEEFQLVSYREFHRRHSEQLDELRRSRDTRTPSS